MSSKGFIRESPLVTAKRYAIRDLHNEATDSEFRWLNNNLVMWLRALNIYEAKTTNDIAKSKMDLAKLVAELNYDSTKNVATLQYRYLKTRTNRLHFLEKVKSRREEVKALIGSDSLMSRMTMGDLVALILEIDEFAKAQDMVELRRTINAHVKMWTEEMLKGNDYDKEK